MLSIIITATIASFLLKAIPLTSKHFRKLQEGDYLTEALDYGVCFIIGGIIYSVAFHHRNVEQILHIPIPFLAAVISTLALSFFICKMTGSIIKSIASCLAFYSITLYFIFPYIH